MIGQARRAAYQKPAYQVEFLCHNGFTWRPSLDDNGFPRITENLNEAEGLAREYWERHRRPGRVVDDLDQTVYRYPEGLSSS